MRPGLVLLVAATLCATVTGCASDDPEPVPAPDPTVRSQGVVAPDGESSVEVLAASWSGEQRPPLDPLPVLVDAEAELAAANDSATVTVVESGMVEVTFLSNGCRALGPEGSLDSTAEFPTVLLHLGTWTECVPDPDLTIPQGEASVAGTFSASVAVDGFEGGDPPQVRFIE